MKCTRCCEGFLEEISIEVGFKGRRCSACNGTWFLISDYINWNQRSSSEAESLDGDIVAQECDKALICPVTGGLMSKYIMGKSGHYLDYSLRVGGIWLDSGEWELIKKEGLTGKLRCIISESWQKKQRDQDTKDNLKRLYNESFGEDYSKIKELRLWLRLHPKKSQLMDYLLSDNPYSAY